VLRRSGSTVKTLRSPQHDLLIEELRRVRRQAGMTQAVLAGKLGVAQSFVAKVENAERRLDVVEFIRWLDAADALEDAMGVLTRIREARSDPLEQAPQQEP
jgi:transcriptional regulator with XRE-family HTH domain